MIKTAARGRRSTDSADRGRTVHELVFEHEARAPQRDERFSIDAEGQPLRRDPADRGAERGSTVEPDALEGPLGPEPFAGEAEDGRAEARADRQGPAAERVTSVSTEHNEDEARSALVWELERLRHELRSGHLH